MTAKRRGLGQGLGALIRPEQQIEGGGLLMLPIEAVEPNPHQPRRHFKDEQLEELADSIREHGILQPLIVSEISPGRYQLIAGERRWRAAQKAGFVEVPVIVKETTPHHALVLALVENIQRADLDPLEEARAYQALAHEFNLTHKQIGEQVGKSREAISNALRLLKLPPVAQQAISEGRLTSGHLRALMSLGEDLLIPAIEQIEQYRLNVREAEAMARLVQEQQLTPAQARETIQQRSTRPRRTGKNHGPQHDESRTRAVDDQRVEDDLLHSLGTKVELRRQGSGGKIVIWFHSDEELESLYQRLIGS
ncbi:MAG: chromosome partitioning protein ParB [Herpetosiphonaceae bacterium]|nr:MAG: chromosome partitioning protein ParB [Herpetosiphonaceae bacterium]